MDYALTNDAGRSAVACLRAMRSGNAEHAMRLVAGMDDGEQGMFAGATLAIASPPCLPAINCLLSLSVLLVILP